MGAGRDLCGRRRTGEEFPVEIGLNPIVIAEETMILASVVDVSERRHLEQLSRRIVEAAPEGILMVDEQGTITLANRRLCDLFGYSMGDIVGKPIEDLLPARYRHGHVPLRNAFITDPELRPMGNGRDLMALRADGREFPVEIGLTPLATAEGDLVLASVTDITSRKQSESMLKQANADLEEFASVASHDLRSPLRGIASLLDWIEEDLGEAPQAAVAEHIEPARIRVSRMESLISDLLNYARAGLVSEQVESINIAELIDDVLTLSASHSSFTLETNLAVERIFGCRTPLATCLRNLVGNAVKHHDRGNGRVEISCAEEDGYCVFRIADDGPGIPPNVHQKVFKLFQTLNGQHENGTGLGLAITKRLVVNHGGSIAIHSDENGRGTTFVLRWPMFHRRAT
jgi:PAS domain S-box-containing protein